MPPNPKVQAAGRSEPESYKPPLLIVDDDYDTCDLICAFLSKDYSCDMALDGQEALDRISTRSYAAILADLMMPNIDGYSILACAAKVAPATPVIVVTAVAGEHTTALEMGAFDYIVKPFEPERVESSVKRAVTRYNMNRSAHHRQ